MVAILFRPECVQSINDVTSSIGHNHCSCMKVILTLNVLNCFKDYKIYIHIFNGILDLAWPKLMKLTLEQQYMLSVLRSQYYACWCTGDFRSQGTSRHGIDPQSGKIPSPAPEELKVLHIFTGLSWSWKFSASCKCNARTCLCVHWPLTIVIAIATKHQPMAAQAPRPESAARLRPSDYQ